ncbi:MAG: clostripain-related cysteine peptidase [Pyrinomonadaceae bacterium]
MKEWTIMVYMAGDNNLSENLAFALEDLRTFSSSLPNSETDKINLLAFFDSNSLTAPTHYIDYSSGVAEKHEIEEDDIHHRTRNTPLPDEFIKDGNSASAYSIMNFVRWCIDIKERTATHYAIIFSGHSFGFHGTSFLRDESSGGFTTLFKFRWALEQVNKLYLKKNIAILGFDSCVMSMLEIGSELNKVAKTIVASEGSLPNSGWSYAPMLKKIIFDFNTQIKTEIKAEKSLLDYFSSVDYIKDSAKNLVSTFIDEHNKLVIGGRSIDIAAWDLEKVDLLAVEVNNLGVEFNKYLYLVDKVQDETLTNEDIWAFQELKKIILQSHYDTQTYMQEQCIDLKDFCKRLIIELKFIENGANRAIFDNLKQICKNIIGLVDECVLKSGFSGDEYQFSNGISLYFPWSYLTFTLTNYRYRYLIFNRGENNYRDFENLQGIGKDWYKFLYNYLTRVTLRLARKRKYDDGEAITALENLSKDNPIWSKDNPIWSKDNPFWSKSNPTASRSNPTASRSNPTASRGEMGEYLFYFSRFKNFELRWDITGFADEFKFDKDFED